jgi:iron(III) transport system substrate-binding protein
LVGNIPVRGYRDLLNPAFKGRISATNPAASSSAFDHLVNKLIDFSPNTSNLDPGWDFVRGFVDALDGKMLAGSGAVHRGVAGGEFAIGITFEDPAASYIKSGATNLRVVYMEEGVIFFGSALNIIRNARNMENAKRFIDFVLSEEIQNRLGTLANLRPIRRGATVGPHMTPLNQINVKTVDMAWVHANQQDLVDRFTDLLTR